MQNACKTCFARVKQGNRQVANSSGNNFATAHKHKQEFDGKHRLPQYADDQYEHPYLTATQIEPD